MKMKTEKNSSPCTFAVGQIVRSKCGRDRKRVFMVVDIDCDDKYAPVVIANGTLRKLEDRKHKNPAHLEPVATIGKSDIREYENDPTNSKIAEICDRYDIQHKKIINSLDK